MRTAIIGVILIAMLGWAFYEALVTEEQEGGATSETTEEGTGPSANEFDIQQEDTEADSQGDWLKTGEKAPDFTLQTLDGKEVSLSDYRGERVLINFWATWCPPCRAEMPDMQKLYEEHDVNILAVNLTETEPGVQSVETFAEDFELTFPLLLDEEIAVANAYGVQPIPSSFFIDREGIVRQISLGAMTYDYMVNEWNAMD
ncbi:Peroxiredoxin [Alteribacillus persepolensis]|uniref:Peroxiredoxin n=1 Tax=Alteribacillus persepolensis TaxID=568899 RepID=A0A1G8FWN5_9BACI|nr:redoxin domain-containing protein [Alteribacillus persepolensis]SDH86386.1 Peroxiredoxin [Alteribacillus persepolensis]